MPGRRDKRQQEKEAFLQQNPELITYTTRIEVDGPDHGEDDLDVVISQNGGPFEDLRLNDFGDEESLILTNSIRGPGFFITSGETGEGQPTEISITENGFGVAGEDELFEPPKPDPRLRELDVAPQEDEAPDLPPGVDTINDDEFLSVFVQPSRNLVEDVALFDGEDEEDEAPGGLSFGIDFTASGRGAVEVSLISFPPKAEQGEVHTETFNIPFGTEPGALLSFDVDVPDDVPFRIAQVTTTGSAEVTVVGIDLETNFQGMFELPN
ncbi:MAG: hypothetical protein AAFO98_05640 [Pseudomonadota bacterium]